MKIGILGWGSLLTEQGELEIENSKWYNDGPHVSVEFVRISKDKRLTLVIHPAFDEVQILCCLTFTKLDFAISNLALREKSKRESDKLHKEDVERYKTQMENYIKEIVILERTNRLLSHKIDVKLGNIYNVNWNWVNKIVFIIKQANRPMPSADIMEVLYKNDIEFRTWTDLQKVFRLI